MKKIKEIFMELWHIKIINGTTQFSFSSKKAWFQLANILLYTAVIWRMTGNLEITDTFIGILTAHAASIGCWYSWRKKSDQEALGAKKDGQ